MHRRLNKSQVAEVESQISESFKSIRASSEQVANPKGTTQVVTRLLH